MLEFRLLWGIGWYYEVLLFYGDGYADADAVLFFNTVSKENCEEVYPKQSALATAHHGRQALQHYQFRAGCAALIMLCNEALCRLCSATKALQRYMVPARRHNSQVPSKMWLCQLRQQPWECIAPFEYGRSQCWFAPCD